MRHTMFPTMILILAAAGCSKPAPVESQPEAQTAQTVTAFDGSYRNTIRPINSAASAKGTNWCDTPGQPVIVVRNGAFSYSVPHPNIPDKPATTYPVSIKPDGSFFVQTFDGTVSGTVQGGHMEGKIDGIACGYAFTGDRM